MPVTACSALEYALFRLSPAAVVSGVVALMLQAKPELNWRAVQQVLARTAAQNDATDSGWCVNAAGYHLHDDYGFGRVDAGAAVQAALHDDWLESGIPGALASYDSARHALIGGGSFPTSYIPHFSAADPDAPGVPTDPLCHATRDELCGDGSLVYCDSIAIDSADFGVDNFSIEHVVVELDLELLVPGLPAAAVPGLKGYPCIDDELCYSGMVCSDFVCCSEVDPTDCAPDAAPGAFGGPCHADRSCDALLYPDSTSEPLFCNESDLCDLRRLYRRGDLEITLLSPSGTVSRLMFGRGEYDKGVAAADDPNRFYSFHPMMTIHHWGESPDGIWTLRIKDTTRHLPPAALDRDFGFLYSWGLFIDGFEQP